MYIRHLTMRSELEAQRADKPVMAIFADHLLVPSRTDCFTEVMWPIWDFSSTPNTDLNSDEIYIKSTKLFVPIYPNILPPDYSYFRFFVFHHVFGTRGRSFHEHFSFNFFLRLLNFISFFILTEILI